MGRPLKKINLQQLGIYSYHPVYGGVYRHVFKQEGSKRFTFSDDADGYYTIELVAKPVGDLLPGEGSIYAVNNAEETLYVTKITKNKVTLSDGNEYQWYTSDASSIPSVSPGFAWLYSFYYLDY